MGVSNIWRAMHHIYKAKGHWTVCLCKYWLVQVWQQWSSTLKWDCEKFKRIQQAPGSRGSGCRSEQETSQRSWEFKGNCNMSNRWWPTFCRSLHYNNKWYARCWSPHLQCCSGFVSEPKLEENIHVIEKWEAIDLVEGHASQCSMMQGVVGEDWRSQNSCGFWSFHP